jgi:hypothetical protein
VLLLAGCGGDDDGNEGVGKGDSSPSTAATAATSTTESTTTTLSVTTAPSRNGPTPWQSLIAGDCIDPLPEGTFTEVTVVDCGVPHAAEAISGLRAVSNVSGDDFDQAAQAQCDEELARMAGAGHAATYILEVQGTILARAVCLVVDPSGAPLTGSLVA